MTGARNQPRTDVRRALNRVNPNADRSAFKTGSNNARNPGRKPVSHPADNPVRRSRSPGSSKRNRSRARRCHHVRPAMPNRNPRVRRFRPPTHAPSLVDDGGGDGAKHPFMTTVGRGGRWNKVESL